MSLNHFLNATHAKLDAAIVRARFHPTQLKLLEDTVRVHKQNSQSNPLGDPLSLLYFVVRAWGRVIDEQVLEVGSFCSFYLLSADLMDDVQDEDLAGKTHENAGPAIAINDSVAFLFLGLDSLRRAIELDASVERKHAYLRVFNQTSILAVSGQHRDLMGSEGASSPKEVLEMQQDKTSSVSMTMELGALLSQCDSAFVDRYREFGARLAQLVQVRDDLRDIFGKTVSPDLATGKITYPIACFLEDASESLRTEYEKLVRQLPATLGQIRALLYQTDCIERSAGTMEQCREEMHTVLAASGNRSAAHRCLLNVIDGLAESIYEPAPLESTICFFEPDGPWHTWVHHNMARFVERIGSPDLAPAPALRPWHLPQWQYVPQRKIIYYPDIEGLGDEILPLQAELLKMNDLQEVSGIFWKQVPVLLAHEMFHFWRDASGRMTDDDWHEEWIANTLAVAYGRRFENEVLTSSLRLADRVVLQCLRQSDEQALQILNTCQEAQPEKRQGYEMSLQAMTVVSLEMVRRLASQAPDLAQSLKTFLGVKQAAIGIKAA